MDDMPTLVVVDDDQDTLHILGQALKAAGYHTLLAQNAKEALGHIHGNDVHLVLTDLVMPGMDGVQLTREIKRDYADTVVILITAYASIETAVQAMRAGAFDYITKPVIPEELLLKVGKALEQFNMRRELGDLKQELSRSRHPPNLIGVSAKMRQVFQMISLVAERDVPVVLTGDSGTGKELVARAIHALSKRSSKPFVPINCGAVPETLLESELFGYMKGAFTGAAAPKKGLFEEADGGTLFLDEIGDAPHSIQMKLLRALQDGEIRRLGSTQSISTDVRVLVATNKNLSAEIAAGRFREDLYYRLNVVSLPLPPLSERREDVPLLVDHFIHTYRESINEKVKGISAEAQTKLTHYEWPGNVRELENTIRRALVLCRGDLIQPEDIVHMGVDIFGTDGSGTESRGLSSALETFMRAYFIEALDRNHGNIKQVAEDAGVSRKNVYEHLKRLNIEPAAFRGRS
jgi:DNA-binding NtrC family response regulator